MHPAFSVIFFTAASGAGYGLLALLGVFSALGLLPRDGWFGFLAMALAFTLTTLGLLSSTAHLGHRERAWRAFSQWRSSWLSREGVVAVATYVPAGLFALGWVFGKPDSVFAVFGLVAAVLAVVTVYCTAMIYVSLKPIHQWRNKWVLPNYLALALMTAALWLNALTHLWSAPPVGITVLTLLCIPVALWLKQSYWNFIDSSRAPSTPESATGLGARGKVRLFEAPHTEENYLLQEMAYKVARKHAVKLRRIALALGFGVPLISTLLTLIMTGPLAGVAALLAAMSAMAGVLIERWLFFAEAKHTVTLYYGAVEV